MGGRDCAKLFTASECFGDKVVMTVLANIRVKWFEFVADARKVGIHPFRLNVVRHVDGVVAQSIRCWIDREVVRPAE